MKKLLYLAFILIFASVTACKTTEANYRAAYEVTKQKQLTGDSTIDRQLMDRDRPREMVFGTDTLPVRTEYIGYTKDGGADSDRTKVKRYCVAVGKFKQPFNAHSMRRRLIEHGYTGALVLHNSSKDYYVVSSTTSDPHTALLMLDSIRHSEWLVIRPPFPYILRPGHLAK